MSEKRRYRVEIQRDDEAGMFIATSPDIPGLVSEAATVDALMERVKAVAPELIRDNLHIACDEIPQIEHHAFDIAV